MKAVILAGGYGTRISEETALRPKPMVEIGGRPILWHIMKIYAAHGITDFVICLGYKGYMIKEFFANYYLHGAMADRSSRGQASTFACRIGIGTTRETVTRPQPLTRPRRLTKWCLECGGNSVLAISSG